MGGGFFHLRNSEGEGLLSGIQALLLDEYVVCIKPQGISRVRKFHEMKEFDVVSVTN